jgi:3-hydroxyacyl-CoA dehydrogenase
VATNTSGLSVTALADATATPSRLVGLHFFNPASTMRLVEVIAGAATDEDTVSRAIDLAGALGKTPVRVRECPGFVVNRVLVRAMAEAYRAAAGAPVDRRAADQAVAEGGPAPMGPFALGDLVGLDVLESIRADLEAAYGDRFDDSGTLAPLVAQGRLGRKTGGGLVPDGDGSPTGTEPVVAAIYYAAAMDEARRLADEGVASPGDIDLAMRLGAGWEQGPLAAG